MKDSKELLHQVSRRAFVCNGSLFLLSTASGLFGGNSQQDGPPTIAQVKDNGKLPGQLKLRLGLVTDIHYADKDPAGTRFYRDSIEKLREAVAHFKKDQPKFVVALGDLIDAADSVETEKGYLNTINKEFSSFPREKHYVLGNHCVHTLTKQEFLNGVGQEKSFYSFDRDGYHFVILDACFREDGQPYGRKNFTWTDTKIPADQIVWLTADLKSTKLKTIVFTHQRLDVSKSHSVKNSSEVRRVLEASGKVLAVIQGHSHKNSHQEIAGIHYCVLKAMVEGSGAENSGYSRLDIFEGNTIRLTGFRDQANYRWTG